MLFKFKCSDVIKGVVSPASKMDDPFWLDSGFNKINQVDVVERCHGQISDFWYNFFGLCSCTNKMFLIVLAYRPTLEGRAGPGQKSPDQNYSKLRTGQKTYDAIKTT